MCHPTPALVLIQKQKSAVLINTSPEAAHSYLSGSTQSIRISRPEYVESSELSNTGFRYETTWILLSAKTNIHHLGTLLATSACITHTEIGSGCILLEIIFGATITPFYKSVFLSSTHQNLLRYNFCPSTHSSTAEKVTTYDLMLCLPPRPRIEEEPRRRDQQYANYSSIKYFVPPV